MFCVNIVIYQPGKASGFFKKKIDVPYCLFGKNAPSVCRVEAKPECLVDMGVNQTVNSCVDRRFIGRVNADIIGKIGFKELFESSERVFFDPLDFKKVKIQA